MSILSSGKGNPMYGKPPTERQIESNKRERNEQERKNMSEGQRKRFKNPTERERVSLQFMGHTPWNKGSCHNPREMHSKNPWCRKGRTPWCKGKKLSDDHVAKLKIARNRRPLYSTESKKKMSSSAILGWEKRRQSQLNKSNAA